LLSLAYDASIRSSNSNAPALSSGSFRFRTSATGRSRRFWPASLPVGSTDLCAASPR